jgi:5'-phosphate synthase pdxT subunit
MKIGILALQGAVQDHEKPFARLGVETVQVRLPGDLEGLDGLVLPGGESTVMSLYLREYGLGAAIASFVSQGGALWGLCAGAILLCTEVDGRPGALALLPARATRNAYGRQLASFEEELSTPVGPFPGIFIRAPRLEALDGTEVLCSRDRRDSAAPRQSEAVLLRSGKLLAASFHPELSGDDRLHEYFVDMIRAS